MAARKNVTARRLATAAARKVSVYDMAKLKWVESGPAGVQQQDIRSDRATGRYFGGVRFAPLARSGVHRHLGPTASYMLAGLLIDHATVAPGGNALVNMTGAVHDVICYAPALNVARVDGAVLYPDEEDGVLNELGLRAAAAGEKVDTTVGQTPNLCFAIEGVTAVPGPVPGMARRMLYDYANEPWQARFVNLLLAPGTKIPAHRTTGMTDLFVLAGEARFGGEPAGSGCYVVLEAETELSIESRYGCRLLAWADGPVRWLDGAARPDLYGH